MEEEKKQESIREDKEIDKKKYTLKVVVTSNDKNVGLIGSIALAIVGGAILAGSIYLLTANKFETVVAYNGFNIGLMLLVLGVSILLGLAISLPIFFRALKNKREVVEG